MCRKDIYEIWKVIMSMNVNMDMVNVNVNEHGETFSKNYNFSIKGIV